jgi:hypothetical protein
MPPTTNALWYKYYEFQQYDDVFSYVKMLWEMMAHTAHSNKVNDWLLFLFITDNDNLLHNVWRKLQSMKCLYMWFSSFFFGCVLPLRLKHPPKTLSQTASERSEFLMVLNTHIKTFRMLNGVDT